MNSKDINVSHVRKLTRTFSATSAQRTRTVGPSRATADTPSPAHLVLIGKLYTNPHTHIGTHTKKTDTHTHRDKHFSQDPLKKIPLNS